MAQQNNSAFEAPVLDDRVTGDDKFESDDEYVLGDLSGLTGLLDDEENQHSLGDISSFSPGTELNSSFFDSSDIVDDNIPVLTEAVELPESPRVAGDDRPSHNVTPDDASISEFLSQSVMPEASPDEAADQDLGELDDPAAAFEAMLAAEDDGNDSGSGVNEDELATAAAFTTDDDFSDPNISDEELAAIGVTPQAEGDYGFGPATSDEDFDGDEYADGIPTGDAQSAAQSSDPAAQPGALDDTDALFSAGAAAAATPSRLNGTDAVGSLRDELHAQLAEKLDQLIGDTVASLAEEMEAQLAQRVERLVAESLEAVLPNLMEQLVAGVREELRPRVTSQIPEIIGEILGRHAARQK